MFHNQVVSDPQLQSVLIVNDHAAGRATRRLNSNYLYWWDCGIPRSAAVASVHHEVVAAAHLTLVGWGQHKWTGTWDCLVHNVLAVRQKVFVYRQRTSVPYALQIGVQVAIALAAVPMDVNCPLSLATSESPCLLVEVVRLRLSRNQWLAAIFCAAWVCSELVFAIAQYSLKAGKYQYQEFWIHEKLWYEQYAYRTNSSPLFAYLLRNRIWYIMAAFALFMLDKDNR